MKYLQILSKNKTIQLIILLVVLVIILPAFIKFKEKRDQFYYDAETDCSVNMIYCSGFFEDLDDSKLKTIDYSNEYWWVDVLERNSTPDLNQYLYCPLDKERMYPSSYKINPNLRLSDFKDEDLSNESDRRLYSSRSWELEPERRILLFYENKDYHRKNYKACYFWNKSRDYLTDQEIVECIKTTRERIKRAKAKWKNL